MARLIDADKYCDLLNAYPVEKAQQNGFMTMYRDALQYTFECEVEAEPVRHGRWIREPNCWYRCSECGSHYPSIADNMDYHYCPNCGAKMDGEEE